MELYVFVVFLKHLCEVPWIVENTVAYYEPLYSPQKIHRHYVWANFDIADFKAPPTNIRSNNSIASMEEATGIDLSNFKLSGKRQILRNCTNAEFGLHILNQAGDVNDE
jgi:hypothetical protein